MSFLKKISRVSIDNLVARSSYKKKQKQYAKNSHPKKFDWNWSEKNFNRIALVNLLISKTQGLDTRYLEIGCAGNNLFDSVAALNKVGVDPECGGTKRLTSDDFFKDNEEEFDVIFIDGLHNYEQVRRDAINAVSCLKSGGWIAFHDFLPSNWKEHHVPRLQDAWTGDCWKLAVELASSDKIDFRIIAIDHGVGVMRLLDKEVEIKDFGEALADAEFDEFVNRLPELPVVSWEEAVAWIGNT